MRAIDYSNQSLTKLPFDMEKCDSMYLCDHNNLTSLENTPRIINNNFKCSCNGLTSLELGPTIVNGSYNCSSNVLTTLKGSPKEIEGYFDCSHNRLESLENAPEVIKGGFYCSYNPITSLELGPKEVYILNCIGTNITSLKGCPKIENKSIIYNKTNEVLCSQCHNLKDISDLPANITEITIEDCDNIEIFTKDIDTTLLFIRPTDKVRNRIKSWKYYEVLQETNDTITVKETTIGHGVVDSI